MLYRFLIVGLAFVSGCEKPEKVPDEIIDGLPILTKALSGYEFEPRSQFHLVSCENSSLFGVKAFDHKPAVLACDANTRLAVVVSALRHIAELGHTPAMLLVKTPTGSNGTKLRPIWEDFRRRIFDEAKVPFPVGVLS